jgi:hypothetical protein
MGIQRLQQQGGGTDWSKYVPISQVATIPALTQFYDFTNFFTLNGSGWFSNLVVKVPFKNSVNNSSFGKYRVKIDDVIVIEGCLYARVTDSFVHGYSGIMTHDKKSALGTQISNTSDRSYGYITTDAIGTTRNDIILLDQPIWFKSKVEVEYMNNDSGYGVAGSITFSGGIE